MKNINDYIGKKFAVKCDNAEQWNQIKELCKSAIQVDSEFDEGYKYFNLFCVGHGNNHLYFKALKGFVIIPFSDFFPNKIELQESEIPNVPKLVGVEMEVSDDNWHWHLRTVLGQYNNKFLTSSGAFWNYVRPVEQQVLEQTLE